MRSPDHPLAPTNPPLVILNPAGGGGRARAVRPLIEAALTGTRGELVLTHAPREAAKLAEAAAREGRPVVAVGGDGTISEAAGGLLAAGGHVPLGIVPAGTGNDYALRALGLPADTRRALEIALHGAPATLDAGEVNGHTFVNAFSVGIDASVTATADRLKRLRLLRGQALYWSASLSELLLRYDRCPELRVTCDGTPEQQRHYAVAAVSLGPTYGGGFLINPGADPTDGVFDLCLIWKPSLLRALRLLPMIERGTHVDQPEVTRRRVSQVVLEATHPCYAQLDGEVLTAQRFEVRILPGALLVRR